MPKHVNVEQYRDGIIECVNKGYYKQQICEELGISRYHLERIAAILKIDLIKTTKGRKSIYANEEFRNFCKDHNINEIIDKYGKGVKMIIYAHDIPYKRYSFMDNEKTVNIINDLEAGMKQCDIAVKHNVSRQYVSWLKKQHINDVKNQ